MKKLILSTILAFGLLASTQAQTVSTTPQSSANVGMAPIKAGNWMVGGSVGNIGYSFEGKSFGISLSPRAGYFVADGLAVGAQALLGLQTQDEQENVWNYGIAPFVRYYFPGGSSASGRFFGQGDVGIEGSNPGDGVSLKLGANVGYAHFVTNSVALEVMAGYNYSKATVSGVDNSQNGLGVSLGFQIYLPGQK
ncbi:hypothetical protein [Sphingobacterium hungaricum]|uniref:Outer membrane protein beta-barrel domain-containing protein n=1 Tax=Sphingobacterium hungaricum TaxID=2082723 RepID=A0A928YPS5_9SPHI|nr:hypothetical protein [Sphingobacterium hungaricum]MBE8712857.1 hypothetical protein [Sphingobacterium hungaricum]